MRIFIGEQDDVDIDRIAGEMLNMEVGRVIYDNGILVDSEISYPSFDIDGIKSSVKTQYGILIIPDICDTLSAIKARLDSITAEYMMKLGKTSINKSALISKRECNFASLRLLRGDHEIKIREFMDVRNIYESILNTINRNYFISESVFTWFICSISQLYGSIENYETSVITP